MIEQIITIPILNYYAGDYRLQYDGKYVSLYGRNSNYEGWSFNSDDLWYEEMLLIPIVIEVRNANPEIIEITNDKIVIDLRQ